MFKLNNSENSQKLELKFEFQPIPRLFINGVKNWHCFGIGTRNSLYYEKGVWYIPNFSDIDIKPIEESINKDDLRFNRLIESVIHESVHYELLSEIDEKTVLFDNIDKDKDGNYIISRIQEGRDLY